jgi:hypothetical protein
MALVPDPVMEIFETNRSFDRMDICAELGEKNAHPYSLIFFKNPGVFNSLSSKYVK